MKEIEYIPKSILRFYFQSVDFDKLIYLLFYNLNSMNS